MRITIKDIANKIGVSTGTISKALNGRKDISETLREKIKKEAKEMGYIQSSIAKKLTYKKSYTIGLFLINMNNLDLRENFGLDLLEGITQATKTKGYDILLFTVKNEDDKESYLKMCNEKMIDGAIFIGLTDDNKQLEELKKSEIPISSIDFNLDGNILGNISSDNIEGITKALDYLTGKGHEKIVFISACLKSEVARIRLNTYRRYLESKGFYSETNIFYGDFSLESGYKVVDEILSLEERPSAILAANDLMAIGAIKHLKSKGYKVPEDFSVMGFDDVLMGKYIDPPLTTIKQNFMKIGEEAANFIIDNLDYRPCSHYKKIKTELIERETVIKK